MKPTKFLSCINGVYFLTKHFLVFKLWPFFLIESIESYRDDYLKQLFGCFCYNFRGSFGIKLLLSVITNSNGSQFVFMPKYSLDGYHKWIYQNSVL